MILEFLLIACLFVSFSGWGVWAKLFLRDRNDSFTLTILLGLLLFGACTGVLLFFTPLTIYVESALLVLSVLPFFIKKWRIYVVRFPDTTYKSVWFWIFCIVTVFVGSFYPFRPDHFFYYEPTLSWLNRYGLIQGVANIDWSLGQVSLLHIIQAGIDQTADPFQRIGIFLTILFLVYIFDRKAWLLLFFIPFYFLFIQAPSPDVAIVFISLIVVNELCFERKEDNYKILLLISVFTFTIKPVAFWLPLWVFIAGIYFNKKELKDFRIYLFSALFILIFLAKNVIASSTLLYPVTLTNINTYWLPDLRILELSDIRASIFTFDMNFNIDEIKAMSFFRKLYLWLTISKLQTIFNCMIALLIIIFGFFSFSKKEFLYRSLWVIIAAKAILVFSFSGQYRFILDGIYPLLFILFYPIQSAKIKIFVANVSFFLIITILISFPALLKRGIPDFQLTRWMDGFAAKTILIPGHYDEKKFKEEKIGNLNFNISYYHFNYGTPPPAFRLNELKLYYRFGIFPQMKDPANIRKGFYMKTLEPEEKELLGKMIEGD